MSYELLKWSHILSAFLLFGTGLGSAFYKFMTDRSGNLPAIAVTNRTVVLADWLFTTPTAIYQPLSGWLLMRELGITWTTPWIMTTVGLYILAGACWLPVVWLQIRMAEMSDKAVKNGTSLPPIYYRYKRIWFWLGWPAFLAMIVVVWLMVARPDF